MLTIDWGEHRPPKPSADAMEARLARIELGVAAPVRVRRRGAGYEARLSVPLRERAALIRLHGARATEAVERIATLLEALAKARGSR